MRLLLDTDAFCKLGLVGLLADALDALGVSAGECGRLPALPHMLKRGRLPKLFGEVACATLEPATVEIPPIPDAAATWLDPLTAVNGIDPGEAQLFAVAAERGLVVVTGDKRALRALKGSDGFCRALTGRIIVLEALLMVLCDRLGTEVVRGRMGPMLTTDKTLSVCFSPDNADPLGALDSYYRSLVDELRPLSLWDPSTGGPT